MIYHTPVLLNEAIDGLDVRPGHKYIDATLGGGGHTEEIIKRGGIVFGIDRDQDAIEYVNKNHESRIKNHELRVVQGNFKDIGRISKENGFEKVSGILFDLGVSSNQIDNSGRGFSFRRDESLDMRMGSENELTAEEIVNKWSEEELSDLFARYGEEVKSNEIARAIVSARNNAAIKTSKSLGEIVARAMGVTRENFEGTHPATKVFQAIRIAVNSEIDSLKTGLAQAFEILEKDGRLAVISFHSLEDRVTKLYFLKLVQTGEAQMINKKPITASMEEVSQNKRSRSAKLRIITRLH